MEKQNVVDGEGWVSSDSSLYGERISPSSASYKTESRGKSKLDHKSSLSSLNSSPTLRSSQKNLISHNTRMIQQKLQFGGKPNVKVSKMPDLAGPKQNLSIESRSKLEAVGDTIPRDRLARFENVSSAWQQTETIQDFLARLPVASPATASVGPWLWVYNPSSTRDSEPDIDTLVVNGSQLLDTFSQDSTVKLSKRLSKATLRNKLRDDLLTSAVDNNVKFGKWMLFPTKADLTSTWQSIAEATASGQLGPTSKVATNEPGEQCRLICVYTYDFRDLRDVKRVLRALENLGIVSIEGSPIYYKCDAFTYLDITSKNPYGLKASLYSSKELLVD